MDRPILDWKMAVLGRLLWISLELSLEEVAELVRWFLEVVKLLEEEVRVKSEGWAVKVVVARSLGWRVSTEAMAREF